MRHALVSSVLLVVCLLTVGPVLAGNGAMPIWEPTTITESGSYVVTRDITATGVVIDVSSDDVTLDLNGFTVQSSANAAIRLSSARKNVTIRDGVLKGWSYGVYVEDGTNVEISRNRIESSTYGIRLFDGSGSVVHRNVFHMDMGANAAINVQSATNTEISENTITCSSGAEPIDGIRAGNSSGNLIRDNRIQNCEYGGIEVGDQSLVRNNAISECHVGPAIEVMGDFNHIEGNLLTSNNIGLYFDGFSHYNVYRRNTAQGNYIDFIDDGLNNTSHGDNYMPGQM